MAGGIDQKSWCSLDELSKLLTRSHYGCALMSTALAPAADSALS